MRILNHLDTFKLLGVINLNSAFGARDHAMIRLALVTGLRVSELVGLTVGDVYHDGAPRAWLDLPAAICKGHRSRQIPLNPAARRSVADLVAFLAARGFATGPDAPLLTDRRHRALPVREVERCVQKYRELSGLDKRATPHSFRHSYCSRLAKAGVDVRSIQTLSGHAHLSTTEVYLHTEPDDLAEAVAFLEP